MAGQLESNHFFQTGDFVRRLDGSIGRIVDGFTLYAIVEWMSGEREELEQFDPAVEIVQRAGGTST